MGFLPAVRGSTGRNLPLRPQSCRLQLRCLREPESWATPPPGQTADSPSPKSPRDCGNGPPVCAPPSPCGLVPAIRIFSFKVRQSPGNQPQRSCSACYSSSDFQARLPWLDAFSPRGGAAELTWRYRGPSRGRGHRESLRRRSDPLPRGRGHRDVLCEFSFLHKRCCWPEQDRVSFRTRTRVGVRCGSGGAGARGRTKLNRAAEADLGVVRFGVVEALPQESHDRVLLLSLQSVSRFLSYGEKVKGGRAAGSQDCPRCGSMTCL